MFKYSLCLPCGQRIPLSSRRRTASLRRFGVSCSTGACRGLGSRTAEAIALDSVPIFTVTSTVSLVGDDDGLESAIMGHALHAANQGERTTVRCAHAPIDA